MNSQIQKMAEVWPDIRHIFSVPHTDKEYDQLVHMLDDLTDEVGENESHPLASLMESIGALIQLYETRNLPETAGSPVNALKSLMDEHGLRQADLSEIGSQGVVSEILSGKRQMNLRQIKRLSERFHVSPAVFM
jgi:HTH-type transcriptional regulator / antitoxin HigA